MKIEGFCECGNSECPARNAEGVADEATKIAETLVTLCSFAPTSHKLNALGLLIAAKIEHSQYLEKHPDGDSFEALLSGASVEVKKVAMTKGGQS